MLRIIRLIFLRVNGDIQIYKEKKIGWRILQQLLYQLYTFIIIIIISFPHIYISAYI